MRWRVGRTLSSLAVVLPLLIMLADRPSYSLSDINKDRPADAPPVPLSVRRMLDGALASEAKAIKIDAERANQFPMPVCYEGQCGAINRDGTWAVVPAYDRVEFFREGRAVVQMHQRYSYIYGFVDDAGRVIVRPQYTAVGGFAHSFAQIEVEGRTGLIDHEGQVAVWPRFGFVVPFTSDLFWVTEQRNVTEGNSGKRRLVFDETSFSINGAMDTFVTPKGKWGLIDRSGAWVREPEFSSVRFFDEGSQMMWAKTDAGWGLLRTDLSWKIEPKFEQVGFAQHGMAPVSIGGRWGFVDTSGKLAIEPQFDRVLPFSGPYAPAQKNKLYGLIDRAGAWVVQPQYDLIFSHKTLIPKSWWTIKSGDRYGLIDDTFHVVLAPQFDQSPAMCTDGRISAVNNRKWLLFFRDGTRDNDEAGCDSMISSQRKQ